MSEKSQAAKIDFILEMIDNIETILSRHGGIVSALSDFEPQMAILMAISQIGESLKKLDSAIVVKYDLQDDVDGAYYTRNYIVHDYENVDLMLIEDILRKHLPFLKNKIQKIQEDLTH